MRNGFNLNTLTSVDFCEIVKIGGKMIAIHEGAIYRENLNLSPFRKVIKELFALSKKK